MNTYVRQWYDLILNGNFENTYKMVWSKALVELSLGVSNEVKEDNIVFDFNYIAERCLKYYWNQTIYFDLIQSPNLKKPPEIITFTKNLIDAYFKRRQSVQPIRFEKIDFNSLEERNKQLLQRMQNNSKDSDQLQIAVEKDYVKKFWISFKG
jgi:hypothetical protein